MGTPRWLLGTAIAVGGIALAVSVSMEWGHVSASFFDDGTRLVATASLNGLGEATVAVKDVDPQTAEFVEGNAADALEEATGRAGVWALIVGFLIAAVGLGYLRTRFRLGSAIGVAVLALVGFVVSVSQILNPRTAVFDDDPGWYDGDFSAGSGLVLSCALSLVLIGLAAAALVIDIIKTRAAPEVPVVAPTRRAAEFNRPRQGRPAPVLRQKPRAPGTASSLGSRAAAFGSDWVLLGLGFVVVIVVTEIVASTLLESTAARLTWYIGAAVIIVVAPMFYFALSEAYTGRTAGKWLLGLRVVGPGGLPSLSEAFRRNWVHGLFLLLPVYLIVLAALAVELHGNPDQHPTSEGLQSRLGETRVVLASKGDARAPVRRPKLAPWILGAAAVPVLMFCVALADVGVQVANEARSSGPDRESTAASPAHRTAAPTNTMPDNRAPSTEESEPTIPGTSVRGFEGVTGGTCDNTDRAVLLGRTPESLVIVCRSDGGRLYYKGVRLSDMGLIEIDDPLLTERGYIVTNGDVRYVIDIESLTITQGGEELGREPMLEFWRESP